MDYPRSSLFTLPFGANGGLHEPSFRPPFDAYILPSQSIFGRGSALRRVRLKTAAVSGAIDCALRLHYALRRHPSCVGGARSISSLVTNYLRVSISACLTDTSGEPTVSVRSNSNATRKPPLAIPTCKDRHLLSGLQSARSAIRNQPPTRQRTDERTVFRRWHSPDLSPRARM